MVGVGVTLWDTVARRVVGEPVPVDNESFGGPYPFHQGSKLLSLTEDGRLLAVCQGGEPGRIEVRRTGLGAESPSVVSSFVGRAPVLFGPRGEWLLAGKTRRTFQCVESATGRVLREFSLRSKFAAELPQLNEREFENELERLSLQGWALSHEGRLAVCFSFDANMPVVDLSTGEVLFEAGYPVLGSSAVFTPDGRRLLVPGQDQQVHVWSLETKALVLRLPFRESFPRLSQDGHRLVAISPEGLLTVLDATPMASPPQVGQSARRRNPT